MVNSTETLTDIKEKLNDFLKLKLKYDTQIQKNKLKIINNKTLSNKEKRVEYLKLKPKCITCGRPGGTTFKISFFNETDNSEAYRQYRATCGIVAEPCNLNINIKIGKVELLPNLLNNIQKEISDLKKNVIDDKNKLLFGYLNTEEALQRFDDLKDNINLYSSLYESYLENYNLLFYNDKKDEELNISITDSYIQIDQIKECMKKMNETNNVQYARDAVNIYNNILTPLLIKIRDLKYNENMVWKDESNFCKLIQNRYSIQKLSYSSFNDTVVSYNVDYNPTKNKNPKFIIEDSESEALELKTSNAESGLIPQDEPIYGKGTDGIDWSIDEYKKAWNDMPVKLKSALRLEHEWMKKLMFNCVNSKAKHERCNFTPHPYLKIPPDLLPNGQYDFGVKIYNDEFNKLPIQTQKTYTSLYLNNNGVKKYDILINAMNDLVEKAVDFDKWR